MRQFLPLNQINSTSDLSEILKETATLKTEISKTKTFLIKFGLIVNFETRFTEVNKLGNIKITNSKIALIYYYKLKVVLIDLLLIVNDNQLTRIFKYFHKNPALFDRLIQGAKITPENRHEIIKNLNLYLTFKPEQQPTGFAIISKNNQN